MVGDSAASEEQLHSTVVCVNLSCFVLSLCSIDPSFCVAFGSDLHFVNIVKTPLPKDYRFPPHSLPTKQRERRGSPRKRYSFTVHSPLIRALETIRPRFPIC